MHQCQLHLALVQRLEIGQRAAGALHRTTVAMQGVIDIEHPADGASRGVVDAIEGARADGQRLTAEGEQDAE